MTLVRSRSTSSVVASTPRSAGRACPRPPPMLVEAAAGQQREQGVADGGVAAGEAGAGRARRPRAEAGRSRAVAPRGGLPRPRAGSAERGRRLKVPTASSRSDRCRGSSAGASGAPARWRRRCTVSLGATTPTKQADDARHEHDRDEDADGNDLPHLVEHGAHLARCADHPAAPHGAQRSASALGGDLADDSSPRCVSSSRPSGRAWPRRSP